MLANSVFGQAYTVNSSSTSPTIDGMVTAGEWDAAAATASIGDEFNSSFRVMWDTDALYLLITNDYTGHRPASGEDYSWDAAVNWSVYLDPNRDGEDLDALEAAGSPDGYQIAVHTYDGTYSCQPCTNPTTNAAGNPGTNIGTYSEAHIDTSWGNQAQWAGMVDTEIAMINDNANGGLSEVRIPWTDLNAPGRGGEGPNGEADDLGLNLEGVAPVDGEVWSFNFGFVYPGEANYTPVWVGSAPFAQPPLGRLTFAGGVSQLPCDFDGDGNCNGTDIDPLVFDIAAGSNTGTFDLTGDGSVNLDDRDAWLAAAGAAHLTSGDSYILGDQDLNGTVDSSDLGLLLNNFGATEGVSYTGGDLNGDSNVNSTDLGLLLNEFGGMAAQSVPEPNGFVLALLLSLGLTARYRTRT